ncbi:alcohol-forming fatty acyl-CoA reductase-like isoform X4 [Quercus robur]|uniref:alcohol-forming fatty acyl-CoA reductase-like isoform X4 n=1 Tax=Quercus robur TaxID=38942 RepID=UPI002163813F|nr:alcohol-forming fatty acyl-CoA reductase-like isoform X4 [Quercus robur]
MELEGILQFFENKTILVTGTTGFLAKVFVEKILRVQPNVKRFYLLVRASNNESATQRFREEVIKKDIFRILRNNLGANLESFIFERVTPISGDISYENFGIKDSILIEEMWKEIDIVLNSAATTNFDERYDVALGINTYGALHVLNFAKKCIKLKVLLHVSTAYVSSEKGGNILESPLRMEDTPKGTSRLVINAEKEVVEEYLGRLRVQGATNEEITSTMKDLGIKRAKLYGWPNTYVYTKALGEMLLGQLHQNLPLAIVRPTMVTSTYKEPFSGWIEGAGTIDGVITAFGKGRLKSFLGHPNSILDVIPADMVVNSIIMAMVTHANKSSQIIFHVGSSLRNPMKLPSLSDLISLYFTQNPWIDRNGKSIKVSKLIVFSNIATFQAYMAIRYKLPLKVLWLANLMLCQYYREIRINLNRKVRVVMRMVDLYKPYAFFTGSFDDSNTENLRVAIRESDVDVNLFYFDPRCIDWEDYIMNTHIPGLTKYSMKP